MDNTDKNRDSYTYEWQRQEAMNRHPSGQDPSPFQGPPVPPKKKHTGLKWTGGILGAFVLFAACGALVPDHEDTPESAATAAEPATPEAPEQEAVTPEPTVEPEPAPEPAPAPVKKPEPAPEPAPEPEPAAVPEFVMDTDTFVLILEASADPADVANSCLGIDVLGPESMYESFMEGWGDDDTVPAPTLEVFTEGMAEVCE